MATPVGVTIVDEEGDVSLISWGAVIAGGLAAAAVTLVLLAFGTGLGFAVVSPWADEGVSATTFKIGAGVYFIVVAMLASAVGGLIAGRFRSRWVRAHKDEVFFRDTAHGLLAWALATVVSAAALGAATTASRSEPTRKPAAVTLQPRGPIAAEPHRSRASRSRQRPMLRRLLRPLQFLSRA